MNATLVFPQECFVPNYSEFYQNKSEDVLSFFHVNPYIKVRKSYNTALSSVMKNGLYLGSSKKFRYLLLLLTLYFRSGKDASGSHSFRLFELAKI